MKPSRLLVAGIPLIALLTAGCETLAPSTSITPTEAAKDATAQPETVATRPLDKETLFELLVAEIAGQRERPDLALSTYTRTAQRTRDPLVAERATNIARFMGAQKSALDSALLWAEVDPDNPAAHEAAATQLIRFNRLDEAMDHIDLLLEKKVELNFDFLLGATVTGNAQAANSLIAKLDQLIKKYPDNHQLWFSRGLMRHEQSKDSGLEDIQQALEIKPDYVNAMIAKARILEERGDDKGAREVLAEGVAQDPANKRLGLAYARTLLHDKDIPSAHKEFRKLAQQYPNDTDLLLSLALVAWENSAEDEAVAQLEKLLDTDRKSEAHSYLGRIAAARNRPEEAIEHFRLVDIGPQFAPARIQMAGLQAQLEHLDAARETLEQGKNRSPQDAIQFSLVESELLADAGMLNKALAVLDAAGRKKPDDQNIMYARAMLLGQMDRPQEMERGLRDIVAKNPNNADALNALGYTLADRNVSLDEAQGYINRAIALSPENPAIIDSMGWLKYRMGDKAAALELLQKAYKAFPDHEVAAHLGELLWVNGRQDEALKVWNDALTKKPDSTIIKKAMSRLMPEPTTKPH